MEKDFFAHETAIIDEGCSIGKGTKIWHFSHIMNRCTIGENCNIGQNVVVSPEVILGRMLKFKTTFLFIPELFVKMMFF
jgi:UDP-2-acetamido-3-amino-2,3-dideoxy-glucuronate N-acetyltransferase